MSRLLSAVDRALERSETEAPDHIAAAGLAAARTRLAEPLRVAIAGRVKAGKSTLLNALVGERLARTDASECTRVVTWFRYGDHYTVEAERTDGTRHPLRFTRSDGRLDIALDGLEPEAFERIHVSWPARRLHQLTLIDTPGLESTTASAGARTRRFFALDEAGPGSADAVVYLMRHLHGSDTQFLESFADRSVAQPTPFNAIAVLSRADELGAGRLDSMASAQAVAGRFETDRRVRSLCSSVVPVAGLLAETGATLREDEVATLRMMAATDGLGDMLLSADRFCDPAVSEVSSQLRLALLQRFGMFGVRFVLDRMRSEPPLSTPQISELMLAHSGIGRLVSELEDRFGPRAEVLKARSALSELRRVAGQLIQDDPPLAARMVSRAEEIEASATELAQLRLWQLVASGQTGFSEAEIEEIRLLVSGQGPAERLGADPETPPDELTSLLVAGVERWRIKAGHPSSDRTTAEAGELVARSLEHLYGEISRA